MTSTLTAYASTGSQLTPVFLKQKQISNLLNLSHPITLSFTDLQKRIIQLWKYKTSIFASIEDTTGCLRIIPGSRIYNALQPKESSLLLLDRLEQSLIKRWQFSYIQEKGSIQVWPWMLAAGVTPEQETARINTFKANKKEIDHKYKNGASRLEAAKRELHGETVKDNPKDGKSYEHFITIANARRGVKNFETFCQERIGHYTKEGDYTKRGEWEAHLKDAHNYIKTCNEYVIDIFDPPPLIPVEGEEHDINKPLRATAQISRIACSIFDQMVQQNRLSGSFNASHPKNPIPEKASTGGSIGGVGNEAGIIEGLFSTCDALEEKEHYFCIPSSDEEMPFSNEELRQTLQELAKGVFVHDTVPFFSLHFNNNTDMYPVIHPAYQNTSVGKIISFLDYYMKGFLNGAFFPEEFVWEWQKSKSHSPEELKKHAIDLHAYCQKHLGSEYSYHSIRELIDLIKESDESPSSRGLPPEDPILSDYSGFRSSFRIIAKQNSFKKGEGLFMLDGDFDVFYTIEPDPGYERELNRYRSKYGTDPQGYQRLVQAYDRMRYQIATIMPKLPPFKKLFSQLNVINFFSYYFKTLKQAQKVPLLTDADKASPAATTACPPLFSHLPVRKIKQVKLEVDFNKIFEELDKEDRTYIKDYIAQAPAGQKSPDEIVDLILPILRDHLQDLTPWDLSEDTIGHRKLIEDYFTSFSKGSPKVLQEISEALPKLKEEQKNLKREIPDLKKVTNGNYNQKLKIMGDRWKARNALDKYTTYQNQIDTPFVPFFSEILRLHPIKALSAIFQNIRIGFNKLHGYFFQLTVEGTVVENQKIVTDTTAKLNNHEQQEKRLKELQERIKEIDRLIHAHASAAKDPVGAFYKLTKMRCTESLILTEFYFEQPEEERDQNRRVVGGCGVDIQNKPVVADSRAADLFTQNLPTFLSMKDECFQRVISTEGVKGHVFKLQLADFCVAEDQEYSWMEQDESTPQESQALAAFEASDKKIFEGALKEGNQPTSILIQSAATAASPAYLEILIKKGYDLTKTDVNGYTALHHAVQAGHLENIKLLLKRYPHLLNQQAQNGVTALYIAVQQNRLDITRFLMSKQADPNQATTHGMTPLYCAIHGELAEMALELLKSESVDVNLGLEDGMTPLHAAVEFGLLPVTKKLLERGALVNATRKDSYTALHLAAQKGSLNLCHLLLSHKGIEINARLKSQRVALHLAIEENDAEVVGLFLQFGADLSCCGWDKEIPLMTAIRCGNEQAATLIIDHWQRSQEPLPLLEHTDIQGETPLSLALALKQYIIIEKLISAGAPLPKPIPFLHTLCQIHYDDTYICQWINQHRFSKDELKVACGIAAKHGHNSMVSVFQVIYGIDDVVDEQGWSLVHFAAKYDHINVVDRFLKKKPSDLLQTTKDGLTLAAIAAQNGSLRVLGLLLDVMFIQEVPLDESYPGKHPLLAAVEAGEMGAIDIILHKIPKSNIPLDNEGRTAGHYAAIFGDVEMLDLVRKRGVHLNKSDASLRTALQYGFEYNWDEVIEYFLDPLNEFEFPTNFIYLVAGSACAKYIPRLVTKGCLVNSVDPTSKETAVFKAVRSGDVHVLAELYNYGAHLDVRSSSDRTPFLLAAELGRTACVAYLLPRLSKEEAPSAHKNVLDLAIASGDEECIQYLASQGFVPSSTDLNRLPYHIALILQGKGQELKECKQKIVKALREGDAERFLKEAQPFSFQISMAFEIEGKILKTSIFHLIYDLLKEDDKRSAILQNLTLDPTIRDSQGRTPDIIKARAGENLDFATVDPLEQDQEGTTILHFCAAQKATKNLENALKKCQSLDVRDKEGLTPLYYATINRLPENVRLLLEAGANPNCTSKSRISPLFLAVEKNLPPVVQLLLKYGANINQTCLQEKRTCLLHALDKNLFHLARFLINQGASFSKGDRDGRLPIHLVVKKGHLGLLRHLISKGASLEAKDNYGKTAAHYVASSDHPELLDYFPPSLLDEKTQIIVPPVRKIQPPEGWTPLHFAARNGNVAMMQKLQNKGLKQEAIKKNQISPVTLAVASGNSAAIRFFEKDTSAKNQDQYRESLSVAIAHDNIEQLRAFLPLTGNINGSFEQPSPLQHTAINQSLRAARYLMQHGAHPQKVPLYGSSTRKKKTPLETAIREGGLSLIHQMIQEATTFDIFYKDSSEKTHLHHACEAKQKEVAAYLIELGAPLDEKDVFQMTPLQVALREQDYELIHLLLAVGARIPEKISLPEVSPIKTLLEKYREAFSFAQQKKETPLHIAIRLHDHKHLRLLCTLNEVDIQNSDGMTALQIAASCDNAIFIQTLIKWLKIDIRGDKFPGEDLLDIALKNNSTRVIHLLRGFYGPVLCA